MRITLRDSKVIQCGICFRWSSLWMGAHWSTYNKRLCVNVIPFLTIWVVMPGGKVPGEYTDNLRTALEILEDLQACSRNMLPTIGDELVGHLFSTWNLLVLKDHVNALAIQIMRASRFVAKIRKENE